jgi:HK97 family phage prohead protease
MSEFFVRSYPLSDIKIRNEGDGRTVEAYAAVFKTPAEIRDQDGHYMEEIDPTAFNRTIINRRNKFGVFYNHGLTIHGTPSDRGSVPIGTPVEVHADNVGVRTVTRYNRTSLAEEVLEAINSGAITAQSFTGRFLRSTPTRVPRKGTKPGKLPTVTRMEIDMREYGPTPFPAYAEAMITGVRAALAGTTVIDRGEVNMTRQFDESGGSAFWANLGMGDGLVAFLAQRAGVTEEELQEFLSRGAVDLSVDRGTVPADELTGSRGQDTPSGDPSGQDTPHTADPSSGDPDANGGHSARIARMKHNARKITMRRIGNASTEEKRGSQGNP